MNSKRNNAGENGGGGGGGGVRMNPVNETQAVGTHRKPGSASAPGKAGARADRVDHAHDTRNTVTVSSLRSRLGPTIRYRLRFQLSDSLKFKVANARAESQ